MTAKPVILVVDDEITNIEIVSAALEDEYEISFALSGDQALEIAHLSNPDLILLDVVMPGLDGYEVCRRLKQDSLMADVPVIFTTSMDGAEAEVRGLSAGAIDYVTKPFQPVALRRRIGNHVQMKRARDELSELAMHDPLTGLANRRLLEQRLHSELAQLGRDGGELALLLLDIDYFKRFNDTYGHPAGDHCLGRVGSVLRGQMRRGGDLAARYGGEEFACLLPHTSLAGAMAVADAIRGAVEALDIPHATSPVSPVVTVSIGVSAAIPTADLTPQSLLSHVDQLLYRSKKRGRNCVTGDS